MADRLLRVGTTMLGSRVQAEDALHDLFVNLVRSRRQLANARDPDAYAFVCLRHLLARRLTARAAERRAMRKFAVESIVNAAALEFEHDELQRALCSLPARQREIIALKVDGDLTFAQIAELLHVSVNTVASRYRYALDKLRRDLPGRETQP